MSMAMHLGLHEGLPGTEPCACCHASAHPAGGPNDAYFGWATVVNLVALALHTILLAYIWGYDIFAPSKTFFAYNICIS